MEYTPESAEFIQMLESMVPEDARIILCQYAGDPEGVDESVKWRPRAFKNWMPNTNFNIYLCVSAMGRGGIDGKWRRAKECYQGGLCFMVDDVGTKIDISIVDMLKPTAVIETSPNNFQLIYVFNELVIDLDKHEALINNFIHQYCPGGKDTGMAGVNRVFRPPFGVNGKLKYMKDGQPWQVRMTEFNPELRYTPEQIGAAFNVSLKPQQRFRSNRQVGDRDGRMEFFTEAFKIMKKSGMIRKTGERVFNRAGWAQIKCPWTSNHTKQADNGAAIRLPHPENDYNGAFKCHHGSCENRSWSDLIAELDAPFTQLNKEVADVNAAAPSDWVFETAEVVDMNSVPWEGQSDVN